MRVLMCGHENVGEEARVRKLFFVAHFFVATVLL